MKTTDFESRRPELEKLYENAVYASTGTTSPPGPEKTAAAAETLRSVGLRVIV